MVILLGGYLAIAGSQNLKAERITDERFERHERRIVLPIDRNTQPSEIESAIYTAGEASDILISETVTPATFDQGLASLARLSEDRMVFVWQDNRYGSNKIFGRMYDSSGNVLTSNQLLAGRSDGTDLIEPKAVSDGLGGFYLAWRDIADGRIYVARYNASFAETLAPFVINDVPAQNFAGPYDIASFGNSRMAVAWEDYGLANDIMLRIFTSSGSPMTGPIQINSDASGASHWVPSIDFDETGRLGVVWEDYRFDNGDVFFQLVNGDGTLSGSNLGIVEGAFDDSAQFMPEIEYSTRDGFAISWLDRRDGIQRVFF